MQLKHDFETQELLHGFAESELKPNVMEWDEAQHLPLEIFPQLAELG